MPTAVTTLSSQDIAAIRSLREPWIKACLDRDWDALLGLCTSDVVFLPPNEPTADGAKAARRFLDSFPTITKFTFEFTNIDGRADLATARGTFAMTVETDGTPTSMNGKFIDTFRKVGEKTWRFHEVIWSSDHPLA